MVVGKKARVMPVPIEEGTFEEAQVLPMPKGEGTSKAVVVARIELIVIIL